MALPDRELLPPNDCEKRIAHECALVDHHLHLFGGGHGSKYFPRDEIFVMNVRTAEKKWIRRLACGTTPPSCTGARCVVIDKMIYSYGGRTDKGRRLGVVYRLDPKKVEWVEVATPDEEKKPYERSSCCLCAIGSRMVMFGGTTKTKIPRDQLQSGATQEGDYNWSNEIYEFEFEGGKEKGIWLDLKLSGTRPRPLVAAAMATIDGYRALLHGRDVKLKNHSFVMNLKNKTWTIVDFDVKPSLRHCHAICQLVKEELEGRSICLLVGGRMLNETSSDYVYVLDCDNSKAYQMDVKLPQLGNVFWHTCHCVQNEDKTTDVIVCGGQDWDSALKPIFNSFCLEESYMKIEQEILASKRAPVCPSLRLSSGSGEIEMTRREYFRRCAQLAEEKREELASLQRSKDGEIAEIRQELASRQLELEAAQHHLREVSTRCQNLEKSRDEMKRRLDKFTDVFSINSGEVYLSDQKLGSGSYASVSVGNWRGMRVAVKKIHELITSQRNLDMFQREVLVCSQLHHPNIMVVCGAVIAEGAPLQIVMELLEGSVREVIDAAHTSGSYLTIYEQLSIAIDMTSGISYLHQIRPRPYVHGDIRPSNVLVARDMTVKVGDLGATHRIESSLTVGPLSPEYLAPERMPRSDGSATPSTLSSDVYSIGVSLIEIFTGKGPIPEERKTQLDDLANRLDLFMLCSQSIEDDPANRISSPECFETLKTSFADHEKRFLQDNVAAKRLVKGVFKGDTHKVQLINISID